MLCKRTKRECREYANIVFGLLILALGLNLFLIPNKIAAGGISGVSIILYHLFGLPVGATMLVINAVLFIIAFKVIGKTFGGRSIFSAVFLSFLVDGIHYIFKIKAFTDDLLIAVIFGSLLTGMGMAIVFNNRSSTGGTDIIAKIIQKYTALEIGRSLLLIDFLIGASAGVFLKSVDVGMYSLLAILINTFAIDAFLVSINAKKQAFIVSKNPQIIKEKVFKELNRSITFVKAYGAYSGEEKNAMICVVGSRQISHLINIVKEADERAFIAISTVNEVRGEGFKDLKQID